MYNSKMYAQNIYTHVGAHAYHEMTMEAIALESEAISHNNWDEAIMWSNFAKECEKLRHEAYLKGVQIIKDRNNLQ